MNLKSYLFPQVTGSRTSKYNKKIEIVEFMGKKTLKVNNLTQSGPVMEDIYRNILPEIPKKNITENKFNVLILGFGGGSFARLIRQKLPKAKITGVEIDKVIIDIADNYFSVKEIKNLKVICDDAIKFVKKYYDTAQYHSKYDLIFIDLYIGDKIEIHTEEKEFLQQIKFMLNRDGMVVFNRLNYKYHKKENEAFIELLKHVFKNISSRKSYSNLLIFVR